MEASCPPSREKRDDDDLTKIERLRIVSLSEAEKLKLALA